MTKLSPIHSKAQKMGARFSEAAGWQVAQLFSTREAEIAALRERAALADLSAKGKILIDGQRAANLLKGLWKMPSLEIGQGAAIGPGFLYRLRQDRFFLSLTLGQEIDVKKTLSAAVAKSSSLVTVTDMTHGWAELLIIGPASRDLLARLCGLDFRPASFPNLAARQSSVGKTNQLIIRRDMSDLPAFSLLGGRSLAGYLWDIILEAGRDLDVRPVGVLSLAEHASGM